MKTLENENAKVMSSGNACLSTNATPIYTRCLSAIPTEIEALIAELDKSESNQ